MADSSTEELQLDPPNELIDTPCMPDDIINTARTSSIGTLTSWQLLAKQVGSCAAEEDDPAVAAPSKQAGTEELLCSPRSASWTSPGHHRIAPRPHQTLYKEYRLLETIGKGAFGTVSIAVRRADGKQFVAKEIASGQVALASAKQQEAIMDEVNVLARMKHPNIIRYIDCFMDPNFLIIIMEKANSGDLALLIKRQAGQLLPEKHIMFLFVQICLAMHHVHAAGVLHRDLKTSNILATTPGSATPSGSATPRANTTDAPAVGEFVGLPLLKLADFGLARAGFDTDGSMAGTTVGTPHYLSPEMCDGKRYGKKTDVWALGCILYEIACLKKAFEASNIGGIYRKIAAAEYAPLPDTYSSGLNALVRCLLAKKTKDRPSVPEILNLPYVRHHLGAFLDWARNVPEAQPEVLLASISQSPDSATTPTRIPASRMGSQRLPSSPLAHSSSTMQAGSSLRPGSFTGSKALEASAAAAAASRSIPSRPPPLLVAQQDTTSQAAASPAAATVAPAAIAAAQQPHGPAQPPTSCAALASAAGSQTADTARSISAGPAGQPAPAKAAPKPNPFYAAAAAMAALPGPDAAAASADSAGAALPRKKLPVGGGSCSLDVWTSANEPSSESLIMAFHNTGSLEGCPSGVRRISSAHSSPAATPRSPLGQYMHSWQQEEAHAPAQQAGQVQGLQREPASYRSTNESGVQVLPTVPLPWLAAQPPEGAEPRKTRSADNNWLASLVQSLEQLQQVSAADAPAACSAAQPGAAAVQPAAAGFRDWDPGMACLNKGGLVAAGVATAAGGSKRASAEQVPTSLQGWLSGDGNLLQALQKRTTRTRSSSYSCSLPAVLSPLGGGTLPGRKAVSPGPAFAAHDGAAVVSAQHSTSGGGSSWFSSQVSGLSPVSAVKQPLQPGLQSSACSTAGPKGSATAVTSQQAAATSDTVNSSSSAPTAPGQGAGVAIAAATPASEQKPGGAVQAGAAFFPDVQGVKQKWGIVPCVSVLAAADSSAAGDTDESEPEDDLPLAVMVKQCLSGNSFMYTRTPSTQAFFEQPVAHANTVSGSHSSLGVSSSSHSGQSAQSSGPHAALVQDSEQLADQQAEARMFAEQQEAVSRFNAFRTTIGVKPGRTGYCDPVKCFR